MKASSRITIALAGLGFAFTLPLAHAAGESQAALQAEAKVTEQDARATALAKVANGKVQSSTLEKEHGRLVWSLDIAKPKTKNLTEVQVDAKTGKIAALKTETPAQEAKELKAASQAAK
jgi:hypothetical protein